MGLDSDLVSTVGGLGQASASLGSAREPTLDGETLLQNSCKLWRKIDEVHDQLWRNTLSLLPAKSRPEGGAGNLRSSWPVHAPSSTSCRNGQARNPVILKEIDFLP